MSKLSGNTKLGRMWTAWVRGVAAAARVFAWIAVAALLLNIVVILRESIGRYFFDSPSGYAYSLVSVSVVAVLYFGLAYTATVDGHIGSDLIFNLFPSRLQSLVLLVGDLVAAVIGGTLGGLSLASCRRAIATGAIIPELFGIPLAVPVSFVVVGSFALLIVSLTKIPMHVGNMIAGTRDITTFRQPRGQH